MSDSVIQVKDLGKKYIIGHQRQERYTALRDVLTNNVKNILYKTKELLTGKMITEGDEEEEFWALQNINFSIKQGERIGIIGRNGAGKSTLLKILSRITEPTKGSITIYGRVASLLEVGTGFHPELSGRENIYLNGAILGMSRSEIKRKFDEIVNFAEVEKFLDTPVKRYSSGMYVRLAFAVAANLEPEILIVDEVLAVGDAEFQKKCMGKMDDVSKREGRTVIFVSHSMGAILQLCSRAILLDKGALIADDFAHKVVDQYLQNVSDNHEGFTTTRSDKDMTIMEAYTQLDNGEKSAKFTHLENIQVVIKIHINQWVKDAELRLVVRDTNGKAIFTSDIKLEAKDAGTSNKMQAIAEIPANFLRRKIYIYFATFIPHLVIIDLLQDVITISIIDGGSKYAASEGLDYGYIFFNPRWQFSF